MDPEIFNLNGSTRSRFPQSQRPPTDISKLVKSKCTDGDIRAALRLLISEDSPATQSEDTASALRAKHPPGVASILPDTNQPDVQPLQVDPDDVLAALSRMQSGSGSGLDGLRLNSQTSPGYGFKGSTGEWTSTTSIIIQTG